MTKKYSATYVKNNFGVIVNEAKEKGYTIIVEKNKKPILEIKPISHTKDENTFDDFFGVIPDFPEVKRSFQKDIKL